MLIKYPPSHMKGGGLGEVQVWIEPKGAVQD
jgi:hypothetical protein